MANGFYAVTDGDGNSLGTGVADFKTANKIACRHIVSNRLDVCTIYVDGGETREGDETGDEWNVTINSDGYGRPVSYVDAHGRRRVWDSVANHFTTTSV